MRLRQAATLIELRKPELEPQSRARGIANGVMLGFDGELVEERLQLGID